MASSYFIVEAHQLWSTQAAVSGRFKPAKNGAGGAGQPLEDVLRQLQAGQLRPQDLGPPLRIVRHAGRLYSLDCRRLWLLHQLPGPCRVRVQEVQPDKGFWRKLSSWKAAGARRTPELRRAASSGAAKVADGAGGPGASASASSGRGSGGSKRISLSLFLSGSPAAKVHDYKGGLASIVLRWSADNIRNVKHFNDDQVRQVPLDFDDADDYRLGLIWHVAEETRAQVKQALEGLGSGGGPRNLPANNVRLVVPPADGGGGGRLVQFSLDGPGGGRGGRHGSRSDSGGEVPPVKPTDLVLLSTRPVESEASLKRCTWLLALVVSASAPKSAQRSAEAEARQGGPLLSWDLEALVFAAPGSPEFAAVDGSGGGGGGGGGARQCVWVSQLTTLAAAMRSHSALQQLGDASNGAASHPLLLEALRPAPGSAPGGGCGQPGGGRHTVLVEKSLARFCEQEPPLNPSQRDVVLQVARSVGACATPGAGGQQVVLVQGPPGTGKTATVARTLSVLGGSGVRVLVTAPTNVAICELAGRSLQLVSSGRQFSGVGVGGGGGLVAGDLLLVGSEERLDLSGALRDIYLPSRAGRLLNIAGPAAGLLAQLQQAQGLLSPGAVSAWHAEQAALEAKQKQGSKKGASAAAGKAAGGGRSESEQFSRWLAERTRRLAEQLSDAAATVARDLPSATGSRRLAPLVESVAAELRGDVGRAVEKHAERLYDEGDAGVPFTLMQLRIKCQAAADAVPEQLRQRGPTLEAMRRLCLEGCRQLFCTVSAVGSAALSCAGEFDAAVVDEAAQCVEAQTAIILARMCCARDGTGSGGGGSGGTGSAATAAAGRRKLVVLVGDPKQLPATVISQRAAQRGYGRSMFERLQERGSHVPMLLDTQYRCRPEISLWPRAFFYGGRLTDGANVLSTSYGAGLVGGSYAGGHTLEPLVVVDVEGAAEQHGSGAAGDRSYSNAAEVEVVAQLLGMLQQRAAERQARLGPPGAGGGAPLSVGVVSPYRRQVGAILERLGRDGAKAAAATSNGGGRSGGGGDGGGGGGGADGASGAPAERADSLRLGSLDVCVRTVDGFQGQERDVIVVSCCRTDRLGFLRDARRLNVAVTRARHCLLVVGAAACLGADAAWAALLESARTRGLVREVRTGGSCAGGAGGPNQRPRCLVAAALAGGVQAQTKGKGKGAGGKGEGEGAGGKGKGKGAGCKGKGAGGKGKGET